ncbi:MAG: hypothetical protein IKB71_08975 [Lentisphaeria bacterium]|nr:hypothetical protein [Lentisphaeria bacterium]
MKNLLLLTVVIVLSIESLNAFELKQRIYPENTAVTLHFKAVSEWAVDWLQKYAECLKNNQKAGKLPFIGYTSEDHSFSSKDEYKKRSIPQPLDFKINNKEITVELKLKEANFYQIVFAKPLIPNQKRQDNRVVKILALDAETFKLRPFKGNLHQHSKFSDGKFTPEEHVAYARLAGFDFFGLSDHGIYRQNAPVMKFAIESQSGITVYPAEELHTPGALLHGLSIGGTKRHSVTGIRHPAWLKKVQPVYDELAKKYPQTKHEQLLLLAESLLLARRAKADGALTVFCHPAWRVSFHRHTTMEMAKFIMQQKEFDVVEVINGSMSGKSRRENMETLSMFHEICIQTGVRKPIMSSSDSHNVSNPNYSRNYNVIFAPDCTFPSFKAAFLNGRAVASYDIDYSGKKNNPQPLHFGSAEYVRYANFLDEIGYWRRHDSAAGKQGSLIQQYHKGDKKVLPQIVKLADKINQLREEIYYKNSAPIKKK